MFSKTLCTFMDLAFPLRYAVLLEMYINAWQCGSVDNDSFVFAYSTDGGATYVDELTINKTADDGVASVSLPPGTQGGVPVRVLDTDRSRGNKSLDTETVNF